MSTIKQSRGKRPVRWVKFYDRIYVLAALRPAMSAMSTDIRRGVRASTNTQEATHADDNRDGKTSLSFVSNTGVACWYFATPIHKVMEQIEATDPFLNLPGLQQVASGNIVCDLTINYANCQVVRRIKVL